ncbi:MAG TPA: MFS transporter [Candidatus Dormibacteraeota bacterium]|nr:MFS transporter [Candidatus Dormibacteraeota bacterium]
MTDAGRDLERSIRGLNWTYALMGAADATLLPYVPLYLAARKLDVLQIGVVLAFAAAGWFVAGLAWAYVADRTGKPEGAVMGATVAAVVVSLVLPWTSGVVAVGTVTVLLSVARAPFTMLDPITLQRLRESSRTRYARIRLRMSAGWALSAVLAGAGYQMLGLKFMPFTYALMVGLVGAWCARALRPGATRQPVTPAAVATRRLPAISTAMLGFTAACLLLGVSTAAAQNFVVLRIDFLGGGALLIGAAAAFQAVTEIPTMGFTHVLTRRLSHSMLFALGSAIFMAVFLAWALITNPVALALLKFVTGVGFALTYVAAVLIADELWPARLRATGQAVTKSVMFGLAPIAGNFGGGFVYATYGPSAMFAISAAVVGAAGVAGLLALPAPKPRAQPEPAVTSAALPETIPESAGP